MIIHDHFDALLMESVTTGNGGGESLSSGVIDITEMGGAEHAQLVIEAGAGDQPIGISVVGADSKDAEAEVQEVLAFETKANEAFAWRGRVPLYCPQYIRLQVKVGASAPEVPVKVTLRVAV